MSGGLWVKRECKQDQLLNKPPKRIRINHDDYYARLVGHTRDKRQFFITQPFVPYGHDFVARYLFDNRGQCIEIQLHDLGPRTTLEPPGNTLHENADAETIQQNFLRELGDFEFGDIEVSPFSHEAFGTTFGLIAQPPDEEDEEWTVIAEPGNYMAFYPPWDGDYDT